MYEEREMKPTKIFIGIDVPETMLDWSKTRIEYEDGKAVDFDFHVSFVCGNDVFKLDIDFLTDEAIDYIVQKRIEEDDDRSDECWEGGICYD